MSTHLTEGDHETAGKLSIPLDEFHDLFTIIYAQNSFLRSEYTALLVKSSIQDEETTKFFRMFEKKPTCFSELSMKHLQFASQFASLKASGQQQKANKGRGNNNKGERQFGGGRGGGGGGGGYGGGYNQYANKNIPKAGRGNGGANVQQDM